MKFSSVDIYLSNWQKLYNNRNQKLFVPKGLILPENTFEFINRAGYPYIHVKNDEIDIFSGLFNPLPILYFIDRKNSKLIITDNILSLLSNIFSREIDRNALLEFIFFKNCLGNKSLIKYVKILEAGKHMKILDGCIKIKSKFLYYSDYKILDIEYACENLWNIINRTFINYLYGCKNRTIVVPLSGGYDSRLIISMLYTLGFKDVIAVTYGIPGNHELPVARRVAERLGYDHIFIEYKKEDFIEMLNFLPLYLLAGSLMFRTTNLQELISTFKLEKILCEEKDLKKDDIVFMPGHTGDFLSGKQILSKFLTSKSVYDLASAILYSHHTTFYPPYPKTLKSNLENYLIDLIPEIINTHKNRKISMVDLAEIFNWKERQYKFISSQMLPYIIFGYRYAAPLWDKRIVSFFSKLDVKLKIGQSFYIGFLRKMLFDPLDISFSTKSSHRLFTINIFNNALESLNYYGLLTKIRNKFSFRSMSNPCGFDIYFPLIHRMLQKRFHIASHQVKDPNAYISLITLKVCLSTLKL